MESCFFYVIFVLWYLTSGLLYNSFSYAQQNARLKLGFSLSPERNKTKTVLVSPDGNFSAGFYSVGTNVYGFAIWYYHMPETVVWMANRDQPLNGGARLRLSKDGEFVLSDAGGIITWKTNTRGQKVKEAVLLDTGNLVLRSSSGNTSWQSFDSPTDTLLPEQLFSKDTELVSRLNPGSYRYGYYHFYFNDDNYLGLIYKGPDLSSKYWPRPWLTPYANGRTPYNNTRVAGLDRSGGFSSSDKFSFNASDYGEVPLRRLTVDIDGNLRLYSLDMQQRMWNVTWIAVLEQCRVHGLCGVNGLCVYTPKPKCVCPRGFEMVDSTDWFQGCRLINTSRNPCGPNSTQLLKLSYTDYYSFDTLGYGVMPFEECEKNCMNDRDCLGFAYRLGGTGQCFPKSVLVSGYQSPGGPNDFYVKICAEDSSTINMSSVGKQLGTDSLDCADESLLLETNSSSSLYSKKEKRRQLVIGLACFVSVMGVTEIVCIALGWWFLYRNLDDNGVYNRQGYFAVPTGLQKFTFSELKRATNNFRDIVGKGGFGTVYKGTLLQDNKLVAVKRLEGVSRGEDEFWAEVNMIARVHHKNLVRMFGFCAEGKHKLLVLEYVENGSLDKYLFRQDSKRILNWNERLQIAVGTAKGLAYLHEECLEWILHCDVKPQNILLDEQFQPRISDFGLAKLVDSHRDRALNFSTIRGTRGYMAPEWTMNLPITAKADVYSFGIILLELVSGRDAANFSLAGLAGNFVQWAYENVKSGKWIENLVDCNMSIKAEMESEIEGVLKTALVCVEQDMERRPSMSRVVEMLLLCCVKREEEKKRDSSKAEATGMHRVTRQVGKMETTRSPSCSTSTTQPSSSALWSDIQSFEIDSESFC